MHHFYPKTSGISAKKINRIIDLFNDLEMALSAL
jgi:hypothetical protein